MTERVVSETWWEEVCLDGFGALTTQNVDVNKIYKYNGYIDIHFDLL